MHDLPALRVHVAKELGRLYGLDLTNFKLIAHRPHLTALEFPGP